MRYNFNGYFNLNLHGRKTRNSERFLKLPSIKLEFVEKFSKFYGAKVYNDLTVAVRECGDRAGCRRLLKIYFDK